VLLRLYAEDIEEQIIVLPVSTTLLSQAAEAARGNALRAGDAVHFASALRVREPSNPAGIVFVTSDKELLRAAQRQGFTALDPESVDAMSVLLVIREAAKAPLRHENI
jgi:predicted nucleic acid-binding protein